MRDRVKGLAEVEEHRDDFDALVYRDCSIPLEIASRAEVVDFRDEKPNW